MERGVKLNERGVSSMNKGLSWALMYPNHESPAMTLGLLKTYPCSTVGDRDLCEAV